MVPRAAENLNEKRSEERVSRPEYELVGFYRSVSTWPSKDTELEDVASKISALSGVPFVAVYSLGDPRGGGAEGFGISFSGALEGERPVEIPLREFIRRFVKTESRQHFEGVHQMTITREHLPIFNLSHLRMISSVPIHSEIRELSKLGTTRVPSEFGWILIGSEKPLSPYQELVLNAAARRLAEVGEIAHLESIIALRSQFLSIASHELKTPLTSIYGVLQLQERMLRVKKDEPESSQLERQQSFLKMVIRQVERLNELIDGLLNISRIQNGRFMVEPSETDAAAVLRETLGARLTTIAKEAGVQMNLDAPPVLTAWVDPVRFEEVVTNLIMNAIRFSPEGGVVSVRLKEDSGSFQLQVRDQGPSVPIEDRDRIFQPFERAQRTARLGGLGLGLFISRQIAQLHGGNVSLVESVPGRGNVFEAYFPLRNAGVASI